MLRTARGKSFEDRQRFESLDAAMDGRMTFGCKN